MTHKSEVSSIFFSFYNMVQTQFGKNIKCIRYDNGTEFLCSIMQTFLLEKGIQHQTSYPYTPQKNGVVKKKHRHLLEVARSLSFQSGILEGFWDDCVLHASYHINRLPSPMTDMKSPFETLHGIPPDYNSLRVFGFLFYDNTNTREEKFSP